MHLSRKRDESGIALILSLMALVVVGGIGVLLFTRTINEMQHARDDSSIVQTLMLARGGANIGSVLMSSTVAAVLKEQVEITSKPGRWAYGIDQNPMTDSGPEPTTVATALASIASQLQGTVNAEVCGKPVSMGDGATVNLRIYFTATACGQGLPTSVTLPQGRYVEGVPRGGSLEGIQTYALPVVMVSEASLNSFKRNIVVQGEYVFDVGQTSFAHYAYFTNRETTSDTRIWFTEETMIDGPTHTNSNFSFYKTPWFGGRVTSAGCQNQTCTSTRKPGGFFYNYSSKVVSPNNMSPNSGEPNLGGNKPQFAAGVQWQGAVVDLPTSAYDQEQVAKGIMRLDQGLHFDNNLYSLELWAGNGNGDELKKTGGVWGPAATWQYIQACQGSRNVTTTTTGSGTKRNTVNDWTFDGTCETWRFNADNVIQKLTTGQPMTNQAAWVTMPRAFNGVIYVDGKVDRLRGPERSSAGSADSAAPALASFAQITVATDKDVRITTDLKYEQPPCSSVPTKDAKGKVTRATCDNRDYANVLGIYSQNGDIIVGNDNYFNQGTAGNVWDTDLNAPKNVNVHAVLMSGTNQIRVEGYVKKLADGTNADGKFEKDQGNFYLLGGMIQENRGVFGTFGDSGRKGYDRVYTYDPRMLEGVAPPFFPTTGLGDVTFAAFFSFGQREQVY